MEESKVCYADADALFRRRRKRRKIFGEREYLFLKENKNREGKGGKYLEKIFPKIVKDIEKYRFWSLSREGGGYQFRRIWSQEKSIDFSFGEFALGKKV